MSAKFTITEGLAELNTIQKRIAQKQTNILNYVTRLHGLVDPIKEDGGSTEYIRRETQALRDLQERHLAIRMAVQQTNQVTTLVIGGVTRTVAAWLTWRKEQAPVTKTLLTSLRQKVDLDKGNG